MFGIKTDFLAPKTNSPAVPINLNQKNNFSVDDLPVHTMAEDIARMKNPDAFKAPVIETKTVAPETLTSKQKTSPFLGFDDNYSNQESFKKTEEIAVASQPSQSLQPKNISSGNADMSKAIGNFAPKSTQNIEHPPVLIKKDTLVKFNWKIISLFFLSIVLLGGLAFSSYILLKKKSTQPTKTSSEVKVAPSSGNNNTVATQTTSETIPATTQTLSYSQDSPNYLFINAGYDSADKIKNLLQQYIQKVAQEGYAKPVEFIVTDETNAPMPFSAFSTKLGLKISQNVLLNLNNNFRLFVFNDSSVTRIGLTIDSKNDVVLAKALLGEEKILAEEINPIFFTTDYKKDKLFGDSSYGGAKIRYQNIISPENLSVDYSIYKNKLIIGTTKLTLRAIVDKINNTALAPMPSTSINTSNVSVDSNLPTSVPAPFPPIQQQSNTDATSITQKTVAPLPPIANTP
jgi:hypothetical protein